MPLRNANDKIACTNNDSLETTKSSDCHGGLIILFGHCYNASSLFFVIQSEIFHRKGH